MLDGVGEWGGSVAVMRTCKQNIPAFRYHNWAHRRFFTFFSPQFISNYYSWTLLFVYEVHITPNRCACERDITICQFHQRIHHTTLFQIVKILYLHVWKNTKTITAPNRATVRNIRQFFCKTICEILKWSSKIWTQTYTRSATTVEWALPIKTTTSQIRSMSAKFLVRIPLQCYDRVRRS